MLLLPAAVRSHLIANFAKNRPLSDTGEQPGDLIPVVKLFTAADACTWLLAELDPDTGIAFGLCDLGMGYPELGYVSLHELQEVRDGLGLRIDQDTGFEPRHTISEYARIAAKAGRLEA